MTEDLRQLLFCPRDRPSMSERDLERIKRGELRWSDRDSAWEVFIPCAAFKNSGSVYFSKRPFRLLLPDLGDLYEAIDAYGRFLPQDKAARAARILNWVWDEAA